MSGPINFDRYDLTMRTGHAPIGDRQRDLNPLHDVLLRHHARMLRQQQQQAAGAGQGQGHKQLQHLSLQEQQAYKGNTGVRTLRAACELRMHSATHVHVVH